MELSPEVSFAVDALDSSSNLASTTSTPPTTIADSASLPSLSPKRDDSSLTALIDVPTPTEPPTEPTPQRPRRARAAASAPVYNLVQLSGTAGHGKRAAKGDIIFNRRRTVAGRDAIKDVADSPEGPQSAPTTTKADKAARNGIDASDLRLSLRGLDTPRTRRQAQLSPRSNRNSPRLATSHVSTFTNKLSTLSKRGRKGMDKGITRMTRELRRLQDTNEFSHVDKKPVVHTVWSNGKFVDPNAPKVPVEKKPKNKPAEEEPEQAEPEPITNTRKRRTKKYLDKGLYAGQEAPLDNAKGLSIAEKKKLSQLPELSYSGRVNKVMPLPIFTGLRTLIAGRDFKLPYHVCHPLPPGQPKPDEWKKMTKNRFIGESREYWRKSPHFHDYQSKCVCLPEDGCGESCQNRIMLYECDEQNCNVGKQHCSNRAFANLTARRAKGGKFRVGVEVIKTSDRGHGVRSNRCFRPNQIIMEYAGEIITELECERRMTDVYKDNECYYLMSFDQNMIIDATTGSIARFVNHSCNPNCRMIKWIVSGQPRMALFAGDKPINTGDELTYDYNFDPFSAKNVQICLCGEPNCRGVLGPKPREVKPPKDLKNAVKATVKAGKRKFKELIGDDKGVDGAKAKKRKIQAATGVKRSVSTASSKVVKGAATAIKRAITTTTKKTAAGSKAAVKRRASTGTLLKKKTTTTKRTIRTYGKSPSSRKRVASAASTVTVTVEQSLTKGKGGKRMVSSENSTPTKSIVAATQTTTDHALTESTDTPESQRSDLELTHPSQIVVEQE
ncbi:hypothetical protein G7046_g264 [Stylonectria norvegica]|nr:hypothetical protein G7046_g264 [Stylonectria norvegica]